MRLWICVRAYTRLSNKICNRQEIFGDGFEIVVLTHPHLQSMDVHEKSSISGTFRVFRGKKTPFTVAS